MKQSIVTLDLEGVLVPEIWIAVAEKTGIKELQLTTRDIPDYDVLMTGRLKILAEHGLKLSDIQSVIATLQPLEGGAEFLRELRKDEWGKGANVVLLTNYATLDKIGEAMNLGVTKYFLKAAYDLADLVERLIAEVK